MKKTGITDFIKLQIVTEIIKKTYTVGNKIPTQEQLAEKYGTTRLTIGMILKSLEEKGVLAVRYNGKVKYYIVPPKTTAGIYFVNMFSEILNESVKLLRDINFTEDEINNLLDIENISIELPKFLKEKEQQQQLRIGIFDEQRKLKNDDLEDIENILNNISVNDVAKVTSKEELTSFMLRKIKE